jgi:ribonuclease R
MIQTKRKSINGLTIDGSISRDLDDAFWLEDVKDGMVLHVSIADVSHSIKPDSLLDKKAQALCTTRYLKHSTEPMLPQQYSEDLLSLLEGLERKTLTFSIPIDQHGETKTPIIQKTYLKNTAKLNYESAEKIMLTPEHPLSAMLNNAYRLSKVLFNKRRKAGAIALYDLKKGITTSEDGFVEVIKADESYNSHIIIQEFMILVNHVMARFFAENNIPALYRNHTAKAVSPEREQLLQEVENLMRLGEVTRMETLSNKYSLIFNRANYAPIIEGHYALNLPAYLHITSPIRRYADLVNMQQLSAFLAADAFPYSIDTLHDIGKHINTVLLGYQKQTRRFFLKQMHTRNIDILNHSDDFLSVTGNDFYLLLKTALEHNQFSESLLEKTLHYLENEKMDIRILHSILFKNPDDQQWRRQKIAVLTLLSESLHYATSLLAAVIEKRKLPVVHYEREKVEEDSDIRYTKGFKTIAHLRIENETFVSDSQKKFTLQNKKTSEQLANFNLLCKITKVDDDFSSLYQQYILPEHPDKKQKISKPFTNYVGQLIELSQKNDWQYAEYEFTEQGPSHQPIFDVKAKLSVQGKTYYSEIIQGFDKKSSKQLAAESLLEKIIPLLQAP